MRRLYPALIALAVTVAFYNSPAGVFVFDDRVHILENPHIRSLEPLWGPLQQTTRPLVQWTLALNYAISGLAPWIYHIFNGLIHIGGALVLFGIAKYALGRVASLSSAAPELSALISVFWAIHPLQTESVTYVVQRGESMMGVFCLLVIYCGVRGSKSSSPVRWYVGGVVACLAGLATKPVMAITPVLMLIFDRTFIAGSFKRALSDRRSYYTALLLTSLLLPLLLFAHVEDWNKSAGFGGRITPFEYARVQPHVIFRYLRLTFWPDSLCLDYGWTTAQSISLAVACGLGIALLIGVSIFYFWRKPHLGFLGVWFFLTLFPTSSFIPIADVIFEHRMYLPLAAVSAAVVIAAFNGVNIVPLTASHRRIVFALATGIISVALIGRTILRNEEYASPIAIWNSAIEASPQSARAHYSLGVVLAENHRLDAAIMQFRKAIALKPEYAEAYYNLGNIFLVRNLPAEAINCFSTAIALTPSDAQMHNNLGVAFLHINNASAATREFDQTLALDPTNASAHFNRARLAQAAGDYKLALLNFRAALRTRPGWPEARHELACLPAR
jgi:tetratricopeptide (TPR) repeat protein